MFDVQSNDLPLKFVIVTVSVPLLTMPFPGGSCLSSIQFWPAVSKSSHVLFEEPATTVGVTWLANAP
jgi:hypothetical protein